MHQYWGFGLNISSTIVFPELLAKSFITCDVEVSEGIVNLPQTAPYYSNTNHTYYLAENEFFFAAHNVAKYYAANGNTIVIEPAPNMQVDRNIRLFLLATVITATLLQRRLVPLHASAVLSDGGLMIIAGNSGAGKSTTLAGLMKKGHQVFSDDIVVMNTSFFARAGYPMMKLWDDTLDKLDDELFADRSFSIKPGLNKYGIFFNDNFDTGKYPVKKILILKKGDVPEIELKELAGADLFNEVSNQIYRPQMLHNNALRALAFTVVSHLIKTCAVYQLTRPANCHPDTMVDFIEKFVL